MYVLVTNGWLVYALAAAPVLIGIGHDSRWTLPLGLLGTAGLLLAHMGRPAGVLVWVVSWVVAFLLGRRSPAMSERADDNKKH